MQQPHFDRNYYTGLSLVAKDTGMPTTVVQEVQERHRDFTQIPNILLDSYTDLPETALVGFFRLLRYCGHRGCKFVGSIRKLSNLIQMAKSTVARIVPLWVKAGFVKYATQPKEDENREEMVITLCLKDVWEQNAEYYSHPENCPKLGQSVPFWDTDSAENASVVPNWDNTVPERDAGVPPVSTKVGSNTITNTDMNTNIDSSNEESALPPYEGGLKPRSSPLTEWLADITLMDDAFLAEMEKLLIHHSTPQADLSTSYAHVDSDTVQSHHIASVSTSTSESMATRNGEGENDGHNTTRHSSHSGSLLRDTGNLPLPDTQPPGGHLGRITQDERLQINQSITARNELPGVGDEEHKDVLAYQLKGAAHPRFVEAIGGRNDTDPAHHSLDIGDRTHPSDSTLHPYRNQVQQVEAAPPEEQPPHAVQDQFTTAAKMVGATSPPTRETRKPAKSKNGLTLQGQHILDEYQQFKGRKSNPGKATIDAANGLVDLVASDEELIAVLTLIRDDKFLNDHNVARDLDFVYRKYEHYRDIVEQKAAKKLNGTSSPKDTGVRLIGGKPSDELTEAEIDALPTPFLRKAARAARSGPSVLY